MSKTFLNGLVVLEALARSDKPRGVTELAAELGMMKSGVHRLLLTLRDAGFAQQERAGGRYECTMKAWELGLIVAGRLDVRRAARPYLEQVAETALATVHLAILAGSDVLYIDKVDSRAPPRLQQQAGGRAPASRVPTGKVLLAFSGHQEIGAHAAKPGPGAQPMRSFTDPTMLGSELTRIRNAGYAMQDSEWRAEVAGLAAPIFDASAHVVAAIAVSGASSRLTADRLQALLPGVIDAAQHISFSLGYRRADAPPGP